MTKSYSTIQQFNFKILYFTLKSTQHKQDYIFNLNILNYKKICKLNVDLFLLFYEK